MGPIGFDVGSAVGSFCSGSWPTTLAQPGTPTATDSVAAEAAEGIVALEAMLADHAALAIA